MEGALIVVDLQNDFLPGGPLGVAGADEVIPIVNRLVGSFDLVVATRDWHPPDHGSFAASHPGRNRGDRIDLDGLEQILWPVHCVRDTPGAELAPGLDRSRIDAVFDKGVDRDVDSYSGFRDNGGRRSTGLEEFLTERGVSRVYVLGVATDVCVRATALDACAIGYDTFLVEDACRGIDLTPGDVERAMREMRDAGVRFVRSAGLL